MRHLILPTELLGQSASICCTYSTRVLVWCMCLHRQQFHCCTTPYLFVETHLRDNECQGSHTQLAMPVINVTVRHALKGPGGNNKTRNCACCPDNLHSTVQQCSFHSTQHKADVTSRARFKS